MFLFLTANLSIFGFDWTVPDTRDWEVITDEPRPVLYLKTGKEPPASGPRRPTQFALIQTAPFSNVKIEADVKPLGRSLMIVFAYRDPAHFDYAHLSVDSGKKEPHHNGIFHVYGGERVRISREAGPPAFAVTGRWYHVILMHDCKSGQVDVSVDGKPIPALHAVDLSLASGQIGLGSFDETAEFRDVHITGQQITSLDRQQ